MKHSLTILCTFCTICADEYTTGFTEIKNSNNEKISTARQTTNIRNFDHYDKIYNDYQWREKNIDFTDIEETVKRNNGYNIKKEVDIHSKSIDTASRSSESVNKDIENVFKNTDISPKQELTVNLKKDENVKDGRDMIDSSTNEQVDYNKKMSSTDVIKLTSEQIVDLILMVEKSLEDYNS